MLSLFIPPATIVILIAVTIGTVTDLKSRKIYNWITYPAAVLGFLLNALPPNILPGGTGFSGALWSIAGLGLAILLTAGPNLLMRKKAMFGGDLKLWAAIGACLLPVQMLICWFYFSVIYGLVSSFLISRARATKGGDTLAVRKSLIALCPLIALGVYLGVFCGRPLMHLMGATWY
jgi:Flp pilus assembly protein protease CpaA